MSKPLELFALDAFIAHAASDDAAAPDLTYAAVLGVDAAPARAPARRGVRLTFWTEAGRFTALLGVEALAWLRLELAKHAPRVEPVP